MDSDDFHENFRKVKAHDPMLEAEWGRIVAPISLKTPEGKKLFDCVTLEGAFRIIQAIPSPKAAPVRRWLAKTAFERLNKMQERESVKTDVNQVFEMLAEISTPEIAGKARKALEKRLKNQVIPNAKK